MLHVWKAHATDLRLLFMKVVIILKELFKVGDFRISLLVLKIGILNRSFF